MNASTFSIAIIHRTRLTRYFHRLGFSDIVHMHTSADAKGAPSWGRKGAATTARDLRTRFARLGYRFHLVPGLDSKR